MSLPIDPRVSAAQQSLPPDPKNRKAAQEFESYMVSFLAQQLRASVPEGPFSSGATAMFSGLFDQEVGKRVSESGGFGLRQELERSLAAAGITLPEREAPSRAHDVAHNIANSVSYNAGNRADGGRITSSFGTRSDPFDKTPRRHQGVDLAHPEGTPIHAVAGGTVRFAGNGGGYGNLVIVDLPDGTETRYAHCATLSVKSGEKVTAGAAIATVGHTGRATGPHLHFEVRQNNTPLDPVLWAQQKQVALP